MTKGRRKKPNNKRQGASQSVMNKKMKKKKKIRMVEVPNGGIQVSGGSAYHPQSYVPASASNGGRTLKKKKDKGKTEGISGFIFMCSRKTKAECYQHCIFGLPAWKREVVEKIKPGTKLFLFNFDLKLLYGVYKATSGGKMNLEPDAFRGKFPAQVRFKVHEDCLPLPEGTFRHAISSNYDKSCKFKPELTGRQVRSLVSLFHQFTSSVSAHAPPTLADGYPDRTMSSPDMELESWAPARLHTRDDPEEVQTQYHHTPLMLEARHIPSRNISPEQGYYGPQDQDHAYPTIDQQHFLARGEAHHFGEARRMLPDDYFPPRQDPYESYHEHRYVENVAPHGRHRSLESEYVVPLLTRREIFSTREKAGSYRTHEWRHIYSPPMRPPSPTYRRPNYIERGIPTPYHHPHRPF